MKAFLRNSNLTLASMCAARDAVRDHARNERRRPEVGQVWKKSYQSQAGDCHRALTGQGERCKGSLKKNRSRAPKEKDNLKEKDKVKKLNSFKGEKALVFICLSENCISDNFGRNKAKSNSIASEAQCKEVVGSFFVRPDKG